MGGKVSRAQVNGNYNQQPLYCAVTLSRNKHNLIIGTEKLRKNISESLNFLATALLYQRKNALKLGIGSLKE